MSIQSPHPLISYTSGALNGTVTPPGDKSISHRSIMFGGLADGTTTVHGLLEGEDVLRTVAALQELGATITKDKNNIWHIQGVGGVQALRAPRHQLDMGNSGTAARLLLGILAGCTFTSTMSGDASLCKRPMGRVVIPLTQMGASFKTSDGKMPLSIIGSATLQPITYRLPIASAQVKSAILLAGLSAEGTTTVIETAPTRDHSENMLRCFGAEVHVMKQADGTEAVSIKGQPHLKGQDIVVPADISSAAFPLVAAALHPSSQVTLRNVGINPRRAGIIETLLDMGAAISLNNRRDQGGEPVADIAITGNTLHGVTVPAERAPSMIDEFPIVAVAAACASGTTRLLGLGELRVKESDRLALIAEGLERCGVKLEIQGDDLMIYGTGSAPRGGATIETAMDHRIAMSFLVLGSVTSEPVHIDDGSFIATSFPNFVEMMNRLGMKIS